MTTFQDLRFGIRLLLKNRGFTLAAVLVLALGIGANTAMFSLVNAFLLKPLVIEKPEELVGCYSRDTVKPDAYRPFSYPNYVDLRQDNSVFTGLVAHNLALAGLSAGDSTRRAFVDIVSSNYFSVFGVPLFRGRPFTAEEERPGAAINVAIVSYNYWKKTGADPALLGKTLRINGRTFSIVGIAAEGFSGTTALISPEVYVPLGVYEWVVNDFGTQSRQLAARDNHVLILIGRLATGLTEKTADGRLATAASRLAQAYPGVNRDQTFIVRPLSRVSITTSPANNGAVSVTAVLLLAMASVVLLIASLNVANMMLARGAARRKEIAVRLALGASRGSILRQLFTEGFLLAILGGAMGLVVSYWSMPALVASLSSLAPVDLVYPAAPDVRVLAATMSFCLLSTLLFGFGPAWSLSKQDVVSDLKGGDGAGIFGGFRRVFSRRNILVMSQLSLSLVLLTAAGLFLRSAVRAANVEPGFRMDRELLAEVDASLIGYPEARGRQMYSALIDRLKNIPGVESASIAATVPFGMISLGRQIERAEGDPSDAARRPLVNCSLNLVGADYFRTLDIPLLHGRAFAPAESASSNGTPLVILDKLAADRLWPGRDAIGQRIRMVMGAGSGKTKEAEVVGVVATVRENIIGEGIQAHVYLPFGQEFQSDVNIHLKVAAEGPRAEAALFDAVRREIRAIDPNLPVLKLATLRHHVEGSVDLWIERTGSRMFTLFGIFALLVASVGLYGVRAYAVARRTREIGIRMAVGASARDTLLLILREGVVVTAVGAGAGMVLAVGVGKLLSGMLYSVSALDPLVLLGAPGLLTVVSLAACYFPARRAARIEPMAALRQE